MIELGPANSITHAQARARSSVQTAHQVEWGAQPAGTWAPDLAAFKLAGTGRGAVGRGWEVVMTMCPVQCVRTWNT